ncbi:MAG: uvrA 2 [Planctomycetaceae bacterium]|nr:uvrA 2 [Planctomycetaceae bacterium]
MPGSAAGLILVRGARTHNLRRLDVDIPRNQLVVITGVSGSGKSSLAFDTLYAEGHRRYLDCLSAHTRQLLEHLARPPLDSLEGLPPTLCIEQRTGTASSRATVGTLTEIHDHLRVLYARAGSPHCPACGTAISQQSPQAIVDQILEFEAGRKVMLLAPLVRGRKGAHADVFAKIVREGFVRARVDGEILDVTEPPALAKTKMHTIEAVIDRIVVKPGLRDRLDESVALTLKHGDGACIVSQQLGESWEDHLYSSRFACPQCGISFPEIEPRTFSFNSPYGACLTCHGLGRAAEDPAAPCPDCNGERLQPIGRAVTFHGMNLPQFTTLTVTAARSVVERWLDPATELFKIVAATGQLVAQRLLKHVASRLRYLDQVGVGYLSLDRAANTLSGGEFQRTRLAGCLGAGLLGVCYILDEPTIGLHPRDTQRLLETLKELRDQGSSVLVVEHDLDVIRQSDYVLDLGPGAGTAGGQLLAAGTPSAIENIPESLTGAYLSGRLQVAERQAGDGARRIPMKVDSDRLRLADVSIHNLQHLTVEFPLQTLVCVSGVSGSGKSSLIGEALVPLLRDRLQNTALARQSCGHLSGGEELQRLAEVDQAPLGRSGRSNPATYSGLWDEVRKLFSRTREARVRGFRSNRFSFNSSEGRCPACHGDGVHRATLSVLSELPLVCPVCQGKRFNPATLEVKYRGNSVADILDLRIAEAADFFANYTLLARPLNTFVEVGLGHLTLGQPANTLSGGESQRVKLATELGRDHHSPTLFVLDEPTTGLHPHDIQRLLHILLRLVKERHSVILIEHHLDLIAAADWIIDLGPEGGAGGGQITAAGSPQEIAAKWEVSHTGAALRDLLHRRIQPS